MYFRMESKGNLGAPYGNAPLKKSTAPLSYFDVLGPLQSETCGACRRAHSKSGFQATAGPIWRRKSSKT